MLRDLTLAVIRLHILYHAARAPVYGAWLADELARHGYHLSYGTLYPALHRMEAEGLLSREDRREGGRIRKYYVATDQGRAALREARRLIVELHREMVDDVGPDPTAGSAGGPTDDVEATPGGDASWRCIPRAIPAITR